MTSSDREQLISYLIEAELYENRLTNFFIGPKVVDPQFAALPVAARTSKAGKVLTGEMRGTPGWQHAVAAMQSAPTRQMLLNRAAGTKVGQGATAAGNFIAAGAKGAGIRDAARSLGIARNLGAKVSQREALGQLAGAGGRSAAVYGGAAALAAGGALGARAAYRRYKRRKAEREE